MADNLEQIFWGKIAGKPVFIKTIRPEKLSDHRKIPQCSYNFGRIGIG